MLRRDAESSERSMVTSWDLSELSVRECENSLSHFELDVLWRRAAGKASEA